MSITPRMLDALGKRHAYRIEHGEMMFAQIVAMVGNTGYRQFSAPLKPEQYMPSRWKPVQVKRKTNRQIADELRKNLAPWIKNAP